MIFYIPLEDLEQRYTKMMNRAIINELHMTDEILIPNYKYDKISNGQFLDTVKTSKFKAGQLSMIADLFAKNKVHNGDAFLVADIFFPGIESIKYMAELSGIKVRVYGFNYAGRADKTDFVQRLGNWADASEKGYHDICDKIFVGSEFHKKQVCDYFKLPLNKVVVTGYIWDLNYVYEMGLEEKEKDSFVIWPHRVCEEKGIYELYSYASKTDKKIVITSSGKIPASTIAPHSNIEVRDNLTKREYYEILSRAKWYLSTAYQETFGYTVQEAIWAGCEILVPDRACYSEMVQEKNLYTFIDGIDEKFDKGGLKVPLKYTKKWAGNAKWIVGIIREEI